MTDTLTAESVRPVAYRPKGKAKPELLPLVPEESPAAEFPLHALGETLATAAGAIEAAVQCPGAIAAQSVLASASLAVQAHYDADGPVGAAPCSLFLFTLAESGERKSTSDKLATRALERLQREAQDDYLRARAKWHNECEAKKAARARVTSANKRNGCSWQDMADALAKVGADPEPPLHPNQVVSDTNAEGLQKFAAHAHGSLLWNNSEAGQITGGVGFSEENRLKTAALLSRWWDGADQDRIRGGDGASFLRGRRLSLHFMLQPTVAAPFLSDPLLRSQGFFARALICQPQSRMGRRMFKEVPEDFEARLAPYEARLTELVHRVPRTGEKLNELRPTPLIWDADARAAWREFHDNTERSLAEGCALAEHRGFGAKLAENVGRIATVLQGFNDERRQRVSVETMLAAIEVGEYYLGETLRLAAMAEQTEELRLAEECRRLLIDPGRWPDDHVSRPALMRYGPSKVRKKEAAEKVLATLAAHGWLSDAPESATVRGERTDNAFEIRGRL